jgi:aminopeptidase N
MIHRSAWALWLPLAALALPLAPTASAQARFQFETTPGHLSKQVLPSHYRVSLDLDAARDDFAGRVEITLRSREATAAIELHAHELTAAGASLVSATGSRALDVVAQAATQTWRLVPHDGARIEPGEYRLQIVYSGRVHSYDEGLYRAPYQLAGRPQRMLATQLEEIFARTLFPSFDEPAFRAAFELEVRAPQDEDVLSNMPRTSRTADGTHAIHRFAATPPMPSYLVAVAVGRFDALAGSASGVPLRILTAPGKREQARYALRVTEKVLPYYSRYFGVPFALPKLDQLAVPGVRGGAMEDWGLISYSEDTLLVDPARSSGETVRNVHETVAHEIAHQWFGNLVTAASWEEIWLNEAFATWMANKVTDHFNPSWQSMLQQRGPIDRAMALDAGGATRAIRSGPVSETAVNDVFDAITYQKGGAVLAMLEQWIGPEAFRSGLVAYMSGQRLSNATAADLWHYIGQASAREVAVVAGSWTDQPGFPLVSVSAACRAGRTDVRLSQSRFVNAGAAPSTALWRIPVRIARGKEITTTLLDQPAQTLRLRACGAGPLVVNAGGAGFYRVTYTPDALHDLTRRFADLPGADRLTLLSDSFALMQAGRLPAASYFALLAALPRVHDGSRALLWTTASAQLDLLDSALAGTPAQARLRAAGRSLLAPQLAQLGWTPKAKENAQTSELRGTLIVQLAKFDDRAVVEQALRRFDADAAGRATLHPSMRAAVVRAVGMHADRARFDGLLASLKSAPGEEERWMLASALASGRDAVRAEELLGLSLAGVAPANVASSIPGLVARSSPFGELAYRYVLANWKPLASLAGSLGQAALLPRAAAGFNDAERAAQLIDDQRREAGADGDVLAAREAEAIRLRAAIKARDADAWEKVLAGWGPNSRSH